MRAALEAVMVTTEDRKFKKLTSWYATASSYFSDINPFGVPAHTLFREIQNGLEMRITAPFTLKIAGLDEDYLKVHLNRCNAGYPPAASLKNYCLMDKFENVAWIVLDYVIPLVPTVQDYFAPIIHGIHEIAKKTLDTYMTSELRSSMMPLNQPPEGFSKFILNQIKRDAVNDQGLVSDISFHSIVSHLQKYYPIESGLFRNSAKLVHIDKHTERARSGKLQLRHHPCSTAELPYLELSTVLATFSKNDYASMLDLAVNINTGTETPVTLFVAGIGSEGVLVAKNILPVFNGIPLSVLKEFVDFTMEGVNDIVECWLS